MRNAHDLSRPFRIDPAYSIAEDRPSPRGLSICTPPTPGGARWLYHWGELESHILARMRHEAYAHLQVAHPGRFRGFHSVLHARKTFALSKLPRRAVCRVYACGTVLMRLNGKVLLRTTGGVTPKPYVVDLTPLLTRGENRLVARVHAPSEPPTLLIEGRTVQTDESWEVCVDEFHWESPVCHPVAGHARFPHQERMPTMTLKPVSREGDTFDFGVQLLGRAEVDFSGPVRRAAFWPGESVAEARSTSLTSREQVIATVPAGRNRFASEAEMALRYLRVESAGPGKVAEARVAASFHPCRYCGAFACSDDLLNRIWMSAAYTLRLCMREFFIDGPKRDRLPWAGDLYLGLQCNAYSFAERGVVERSLTVLYGEDPRLCDVSGIIDYSLWWAIALRDYVACFGDLRYLARARPLLLRLLEALESHEDADGFLTKAEGAWLFIDWAEIDKTGVSSCLQWVYVMGLEAAGEALAWSGDADLASRYRRKAEALRLRARQRFWAPSRRCFVDGATGGKRSGHVSRHANFLAVLAGAAPLAEVMHLLRDDGLPAVGTPYMMALELRALARGGEKHFMLDRIRRYWGQMLDLGATTFWEGHDEARQGDAHYGFYGRPFGKSLCHAWSAGPVFLLSGELLGLRPLAPGWRRASFAPDAAGLDWLAATVPTPQGDIRVEIDRGRTRIRAPKGMEVVVGG